MPPINEKLLAGTVDMLVLTSVQHAPSYGYAITRDVLQWSDNRIALTKGALYICLHRLERQGALTAKWVTLPSGRKRKYYYLTSAGEALLIRKRQRWDKFSSAMDKLVGSTR